MILTGSGKDPVTRALYAAFVAAVAQAPVVQPFFSLEDLDLDTGIRALTMKWLDIKLFF